MTLGNKNHGALSPLLLPPHCWHLKQEQEPCPGEMSLLSPWPATPARAGQRACPAGGVTIPAHERQLKRGCMILREASQRAGVEGVSKKGLVLRGARSDSAALSRRSRIPRSRGAPVAGIRPLTHQTPCAGFNRQDETGDSSVWV